MTRPWHQPVGCRARGSSCCHRHTHLAGCTWHRHSNCFRPERGRGREIARPRARAREKASERASERERMYMYLPASYTHAGPASAAGFQRRLCAGSTNQRCVSGKHLRIEQRCTHFNVCPRPNIAVLYSVAQHNVKVVSGVSLPEHVCHRSRWQCGLQQPRGAKFNLHPTCSRQFSPTDSSPRVLRTAASSSITEHGPITMEAPGCAEIMQPGCRTAPWPIATLPWMLHGAIKSLAPASCPPTARRGCSPPTPPCSQ